MDTIDTLSLQDRYDIHALPVRYANAIDQRDWTRFRTVFTHDCYYELTNFGRLTRSFEGIDELTNYMASVTSHPTAHHVSNVEILAIGDPIKLLSQVFGPGKDGVFGSCDYRDDVVHTNDGWRIARRIVMLRRPSNI